MEAGYLIWGGRVVVPPQERETVLAEPPRSLQNEIVGTRVGLVARDGHEH